MTTNNSNAEKWHLYHGTSLTRLVSIVELGLLSSHILMDRKWPIMWGCSPGTCMTPNYALAWQYARIEEGVSGAVVLKIEVDRKDLLEDPDPSHMPGQSFYVTQPIPPERIVGVSTNPDTFEPQSVELLLPKPLDKAERSRFNVGSVFQLNDAGAVEILDIPLTRTALVRWVPEEGLYDDPFFVWLYELKPIHKERNNR